MRTAFVVFFSFFPSKAVVYLGQEPEMERIGAKTNKKMEKNLNVRREEVQCSDRNVRSQAY